MIRDNSKVADISPVFKTGKNAVIGVGFILLTGGYGFSEDVHPLLTIKKVLIPSLCTN